MHGAPLQILSWMILRPSRIYKPTILVPNIYDLDVEEIHTLLSSWHQPSYRTNQVWEGLYTHLWNQPSQFTSLPKNIQRKLADHFGIQHLNDAFSSLKPDIRLISADGETIKTLFRLADENAVEAVLMRYTKRCTLCISTQAGCAMGCVFCATGQMGFRRHLSSGEIVDQVLYYARELANQGESVTNVVVMGMGEPFHNYEATMEAIYRLNHPKGFNFGARRFTISTVGLIPAIQRFTRETHQVNLAISLHAANDEVRNLLLPINRKYPVDQLLVACLEYIHTTHRRITFEWALIDGVNDSPSDARLLADKLLPFRISDSVLCHVNLIQLNPTQKYSGSAATTERARLFKAELGNHGIPCSIRLRRGIDIQAGCGQLATHNSSDESK
jgi:23S rRNA (adenine2503-C2)-methyltransferase